MQKATRASIKIQFLINQMNDKQYSQHAIRMLQYLGEQLTVSYKRAVKKAKRADMTDEQTQELINGLWALHMAHLQATADWVNMPIRCEMGDQVVIVNPGQPPTEQGKVIH